MAGGHGASQVSPSWAEPDAAPSLLGGEVTRVHGTCMQIEFPPNLLKFGGLEGGNHSYLFTGNVINGAVLKSSRKLFHKWCRMLPDGRKMKTFSFNDCQNILES